MYSATPRTLPMVYPVCTTDTKSDVHGVHSEINASKQMVIDLVKKDIRSAVFSGREEANYLRCN